MLCHLFHLLHFVLLRGDDGIDGRVDTAFENVVVDLLDAEACADIEFEGLLEHRQHFTRFIFEVFIECHTVCFGIVEQLQYRFEAHSDVGQLHGVEFVQFDTPCDPLEVVDLLQVCLEAVGVWQQLLYQVVACLKQRSVTDGVEQALFEQPFAKGGGGFVHKVEQCHICRVAADDGELLHRVVADVHVAAVAQKVRAVHLLYDTLVVLDDEVYQHRQRLSGVGVAFEVEVFDGA